MDALWDIFRKQCFNRYSLFLVVASQIVWTTLTGFLVGYEIPEERNSFSCRIEGQDKEFFQRICFADYQAKTTRGFPLYGFVLLYFPCVTLVAIFYSLSVRTRIGQIERQDQQARSANQSCRLYCSYCIQLAIRLVIGMSVAIAQCVVYYPLHFPSKHACDLTHIQQAKVVNATKFQYVHECYNLLAGVKTGFTISVLALILLITIFNLVELIYVIVKAQKSNDFRRDPSFFKIHLQNRTNNEEMQNRTNNEEMQNIVKNYIAKLKENIKKETKYYEPLLPGEEGQSRELDTIYTNLIVYPGRAAYHFSRERHEIVEGYLKSQEQRKSINKLEEIFAPKPGNPQDRPLSIMIIGRPGIGKSLLCQKILRDWACGKIFNEETETGRRFEFVCYFKFRHFRSDDTMNLQGLLGRGQFLIGFPQEAYDWMLNHPEQVLLVFDGLDEFDGKENIVQEEPRYVNEDTEKMSFSAMYAKLTLGKLLRGATVVTTSRPTALSCVSFPRHTFDQSLEILGFSNDQIETFVTGFCEDSRDEDGKQIWDHISSNGNLLSLCYVPVSCHIICFTLQERLKPGKDNGVKCLQTTLTEIYKDALIIIIFKHNPNYRHNLKEQDRLLTSLEFFPEVEESLNSLGEVAYAGIEDGRLIFESSEVKGHKECGLLHRLPNVKVDAIQRKEQYCFLHLTLQEFLAAKYIVAQIKEGNSEFESWISGHVRLAGKWEVVMQFVAGLLPDEDISNVTTFIKSLPDPTGRERWPCQSEKAKLVLRLFKYIFEIPRKAYNGSEELIRVKLSGVVNVDLSQMSLTDADVTSVAFVLQEAKNITSLNVSGNFITSIGCKEISDKLLKMLGSSDSHNSSECKLTALNISRNKIGVEGVKYLSDVLAKVECKLTTLDVSGNDAGVKGVKYLSNVLAKVECKLTTLDISRNDVGVEGVKYLSDALATDECKLTTLTIMENKIGDDGVKYLTHALVKNECKLTKLDISWNKIGPEGVKHLSDALATDECKLTTLDISNNKIGVQGVKYVSDALATDECKLTTLGISFGNTLDKSTCLLDALSKKECKITTLGITAVKMPANLLQYLSGALSSNECKLTTLNIQGWQIPADLLKHLPGTLSTLNIKSSCIGNDGLKPLCDALSSDNCKVTTLKISTIHIHDDGLKPLCDTLSSDNCKLTTLKISVNHIKDYVLKQLCDALSSDNCKLTTLNIYFPGIGEHELNQLSDALGTKECKITTTEDIEENERGADDVQFSSNEHKLTTLNVYSNNLAHHLCDITKNDLH